MSGEPTPPVGGVRFGDLRRTEPIARNFGYGRGTPVDRYYIEGFLERNAAVIGGRVLEVGGDEYTRRFGGSSVARVDVLSAAPGNPAATIVADLADAPHLPDAAFDCVICTQTLQYIYDLRAAVATLRRILKPGGTLLATVPGITPIDDAHWRHAWFWNLTDVSARRLFGDEFGAGQVEVTSRGNVLAAVCFLHGLAVEELTAAELTADDPAIPFLITIRATGAGPRP